MQWTKGKLVVGLTKLLGHLPMSLSQSIGSGLGRCVWAWKGRTRHVAETNIKACFPDLSPDKQRTLAKNAVIASGKTLIETGTLWSCPFEYGRSLIKSVHNEPLLDAALAAKQGLILILPHLGNWELTNHYITSKTDLLAMYQPAKLPELEAWMTQARNQCGTEMVPTNASGVKALYRHLKQGGTTVVLADQEPPQQSGEFVPFFNVPALTPVLVPRLIRQTKAKALMIFTLRCKQRATFEVYIQEVDPALYSDDLSEATRGLNRSIELSVTQAIEQYQWAYKRFKRQPKQSAAPFYNR